MADLATLSIAVDSRAVKSADKDLDSLSATGAKAERAMAKLVSVFAALAAAAAGLKAFYDTNAEFQRLSASLVTVTGSTDKANRAFGMLQTLAQNTPYELSQVTQAFIDLKTRGMDASAESMISYGNMASSFGRSMEDTIRAISGVAMGETEAIKSFGVQAQANGDKIALTFRGQTEVVKRSMGAVEAYFKRLSDANFAGGMERQMNTLGGAMSNLQDQIAATFFAMGNAGLSDKMISGIKGLTQSIADATPALVGLATNGVNAFNATYAAAVQYSGALKAMVAIPVAMWLNTAVSATAALIAPTIRAIALTTALSVQAGSFGIAATAAAAGTTLWNGALSVLGSTAGMLAIGLGALYIATKGIRDETDRLNEATAAQQNRYALLGKPLDEARDKLQDLREENERLQKVLKGDKNVQILDPTGQALVNQIRKNGGNADQIWYAEELAKKVTAQVKLNADLKKSLEDKNKATRDAAELEKKHLEQKKTFVEKLKDEIATHGLGKAAMVLYEAAKLKLTGADLKRANTLAGLIKKEEEYARWQELNSDWLEKDSRKRQVEEDRLFRITDWAQGVVESLDDQTAAARRYASELAAINYQLKQGEISEAKAVQLRSAAWGRTETGQMTQRYNPALAFDMAKDRLDRIPGLDSDTYTKALRDLRYEFDATFRTLSDGMMNLGDNMARSFANWIMKIDGAKFALKDLARSFAADMASMFAQQASRQFMGWVMGGISSAWGGFGSGSGGSTTYNPGSGSGVGMNPRGFASDGPAPSIVVNVNSATGAVDASGGTGAGVDLGKRIAGAVKAVIADEMRPGGQLASVRR